MDVKAKEALESLRDLSLENVASQAVWDPNRDPKLPETGGISTRRSMPAWSSPSMRTEASTLSPPEPCQVSIPAASKLIGERRTFLSRAGRMHGADASVSVHSAHTYWPGLERSSAIVAAQLPFTGAMFWLMWKRLSGS